MSERLTIDELDMLRFNCDDALSDMSLTHGRLVRALQEIQERRANDLTPDEIETVREMLAEFEANDSAWEGGTEDVVAVCRKLLRAHGATP